MFTAAADTDMATSVGVRYLYDRKKNRCMSYSGVFLYTSDFNEVILLRTNSNADQLACDEFVHRLLEPFNFLLLFGNELLLFLERLGEHRNDRDVIYTLDRISRFVCLY